MGIQSLFDQPVQAYLIAKEKKVSLAWVVREAADKYIAEKWPLFSGSKVENS